MAKQTRNNKNVDSITGVVAAGAAGGVRSGGERLATLQFHLDRWRVDDGPVQSEPLYVSRKVNDRELDRLMNRIEPYSVIQLQARLVKFSDPRTKKSRVKAAIEKVLKYKVDDRELAAHARRLQEPVKHRDPVVGTLTYDRRLNWYSGKVKWNGRRVDLNVSIVKPEHLDEALKTAHALWRDQAAWDRRIRAYAPQKLLKLKNRIWSDEEDEPKLTEKDFERKMKLEGITVYRGGGFEFWHDDGGLFWGHSIVVRGSLTKGPQGADIQG